MIIFMNATMTHGKATTGSGKQGYFMCGTNIQFPCTDLGLFLPHKLYGGNLLEVDLRECNKVVKTKHRRKACMREALVSTAAEGWGRWESAGAFPDQTKHQ